MKKSPGFSLIEVLVFVAVLSLFFISAVTITTFSLRNLKIQEHKIIATRYAEEASEWIKQEKEDDWEIFKSHSDTYYCLNLLNWDVGACTSYFLGTPGFFKRDLNVSRSGNPIDKITTVLTVSWLENGVPQNVILKSVYNLWE